MPYGLYDACYDHPTDLGHCDHFFKQPTDFGPARYIELEAMMMSNQAQAPLTD
jgi:hypothetical protein